MKTSNHHARFKHTASHPLTNALAALLAVTGLALTQNAAAALAEVQVRVVDMAKGSPVAGAAVCLGTSANARQFGALVTSSDGTATFEDVPSTPLVLTVSKGRYMGYQSPRAGAQSNRVFVVALSPGGLGPKCTNPTVTQRVAEPTTDFDAWIRSFQINKGESRTGEQFVVLSSRLTREPTHYRASERADFRDANWMPFEQAPRFELSAGKGKKTIYFQVRKYKEIDGASIESLSNVSSDTISVLRN